jgi:hypothetical protein
MTRPILRLLRGAAEAAVIAASMGLALIWVIVLVPGQ